MALMFRGSVASQWVIRRRAAPESAVTRIELDRVLQYRQLLLGGITHSKNRKVNAKSAR